MHAGDTERTPQRNPFNTEWRTNLPSFQQCLASLGTRDNFCGLGEVLAAASPHTRERVECTGVLTSAKVANVDFSFYTLEVSDATLPGTPPQPVESYQQSCAPSSEQTPRCNAEEAWGECHTLTPSQLPPLCPNISPIANSPSAARRESFSAPRTEPQEVRAAYSTEREVSSEVLKNAMNLDAVFGMEFPNYPDEAPVSPAADAAPAYREALLLNNLGVLGESCCIREQVDRVIPPLREWIDGNWISDPTYRYGDFAYHHPLLYRVGSGAAMREVQGGLCCLLGSR